MSSLHTLCTFGFVFFFFDVLFRKVLEPIHTAQCAIANGPPHLQSSQPSHTRPISLSFMGSRSGAHRMAVQKCEPETGRMASCQREEGGEGGQLQGFWTHHNTQCPLTIRITWLGSISSYSYTACNETLLFTCLSIYRMVVILASIADIIQYLIQSSVCIQIHATQRCQSGSWAATEILQPSSAIVTKHTIYAHTTGTQTHRASTPTSTAIPIEAYARIYACLQTHPHIRSYRRYSQFTSYSFQSNPSWRSCLSNNVRLSCGLLDDIITVNDMMIWFTSMMMIIIEHNAYASSYRMACCRLEHINLFALC